MASFTLRDGARSPVTAAAPGSKSSAITIETLVKSRKPNRAIRKKLGRSLEKGSLDLDRTSAEQGLGVYYAGSSASYDASPVNTSLADLTWNSSTVGGGRRSYHYRSASGTSQFSSRTSGSYNKNGGFQHPWQQTPRPYTPPGAASFQGSFGSELDRQRVSFADEELVNARSRSTLSNHTAGTAAGGAAGGAAGDAAGEAAGGASTPLLLENPDAKLSRVISPNINRDKPPPLARNSSLPLFTTDTTTSSEIQPETSDDTYTQPSSVRSSMEIGGYRLRSRSEGGGLGFEKKPINEIEAIHEARRRFDEKERIKDERAAREHVKALEKKNIKEALKAESRARKSATTERSRIRVDGNDGAEKGNNDIGETMEEFLSRGYGQDPAENEHNSRRPHLGRKALAVKRKTHGAWTSFMIWFRTRLLRLSEKF